MSVGSQHVNVLRRMVEFLREWDTEDNHADADLLEEIIDQLDRSDPVSRLRMSKIQLELLQAVADGHAHLIHPMGMLPMAEIGPDLPGGKRIRFDTVNALVKRGLIENPPYGVKVNWQPVRLRITERGTEILAKGQ